MQEELILIDKLEDQIIDHPDASTKQELHDNSLDETFQKKLNARAEQIANQSLSPDGDPGDPKNANGDNFQFLVDKPELVYDYEDYGSLSKELNEWFAYNDFKVLGGLANLPGKYKQHLKDYKSGDDDVTEFEGEFLQDCVEKLHESRALDSIVYYVFGKFAECQSVSDQINNIRSNVRVLTSMGILKTVTSIIKLFINERIEHDNSDNPVTSEVTGTTANDFFKLLTVFYFIINAYIQANDSPDYIKVRHELSDIDILTSIVTFIEHWKLNPNSNYRIRYLLLILWKLILLEFGDSKTIEACDKFLVKHHKIQNKYDENNKGKLTCSPLDYFTFREDLLDKYPLFQAYENLGDCPLKKDAYDFKQFKSTLKEANGESISTSSSSSSIQEDYKYFMAINSQSNSLSNYMSNPRPNKAHTVQSQLPTATVHISTPVPSPPSTPSDFMSGGEKIRKLYQINQSVPLIYPKTDEVEVPYAIKEANDILQSSVYDSYSNKRLWQERQKFMIQERGYVNEYDDTDYNDNLNEFEYDEAKLLKQYPSKQVEINSIMRVERFYSNNVEKLTNLIKVVVDIIMSNKIEHNLNFIEKELNGETDYYEGDGEGSGIDPNKKRQVDKILIQQLEVLHIKEITLKAGSSIILLLLKWFKINHVLKYYYFTTILFDEQIFSVIMDYLSNSFNNSNIHNAKTRKEFEFEKILYQNKLMNPKIDLENLQFFNNCLQKNVKVQRYKLINTKKLTEFESKYSPADNYCRIFINQYNENFLMIMINLINITNKILIKNYTQRILTLNELKPSEMFKMLVIHFNNRYLSSPILKILKKLTPYQGRKWKSVNMDLISLIYLKCRLSLKDNWLSGRDLESDFNNSFDQEISLRGLLQFYNMRKYPHKMVSLGYEISKDFASFPLDDDFDCL